MDAELTCVQVHNFSLRESVIYAEAEAWRKGLAHPCIFGSPSTWLRLPKGFVLRGGTSLSAVVAGFLKRWVGEADEAGEDASSYEFLKREYRRVYREFERLRNIMREEDPEGELWNLAEELGLDTERLTNMEKVVAKLLNAYEGPTEKLHLFIDYLEAATNLCQKQEQLTNIRKQKYTPSLRQPKKAFRRY